MRPVPQLERGGSQDPSKRSQLLCPGLQDEASGELRAGAGTRQAAGEPGRAGDTHLSSFPPGLLESRRLAGTT